MGFLSSAQVSAMGFASVGDNVLLSDKASFYNCENISIGNNVRIDDFCVLSAGEGGIQLRNYIHIAAYSLLIGAGKILMSDFSGISSRVSIYSSSDDYTGATMTNPVVPKEYTGVHSADVVLGRHVIVGSGSVILPGVQLSEGCAVGALSLVSKNFEPLSVVFGNPAKKIKTRDDNFLKLEKDFLESMN